MKHECQSCIFNSKIASLLRTEDFLRLGENHLVLRFQRGDTIVKQGTYSTNVVFLRKGVVKLHLAGPHYEQIVRLVKAPTYLGLPTTFGDKINQYSITAIVDTEVCFIDIKTFEGILNSNSTFSKEIILDLCRNELDSFSRCANRTQKQARGNLASFLLELSAQIFDSNTFELPLTQTEIGNLIDSTRESVNRILSEFHADGLIFLEGKKITILNQDVLNLVSKNG